MNATIDNVLFDVWMSSRSLSMEERALFFDILMKEALSGKRITGDEQFLARAFHMSTRKFRSVAQSLAATGLIKFDGRSIAAAVPSPFENLKLAKVYGRQEIPQATRLAVYERDNYACVKCGSEKNLSCDHIVAVTSGGDNSVGNLRTLCRPCNSKKGAKNGGAK